MVLLADLFCCCLRRQLHSAYKSFKQLGGFEPQRPLRLKELLEKQTLQLQDCIQRAGLAGVTLQQCAQQQGGLPGMPATPDAAWNWQGFDTMRAEPQQQQHSGASISGELEQLLVTLTDQQEGQQRQGASSEEAQRVSSAPAAAAAAVAPN
jgi:hypothetical protein